MYFIRLKGKDGCHVNEGIDADSYYIDRSNLLIFTKAEKFVKAYSLFNIVSFEKEGE